MVNKLSNSSNIYSDTILDKDACLHLVKCIDSNKQIGCATSNIKMFNNKIKSLQYIKRKNFYLNKFKDYAKLESEDYLHYDINQYFLIFSQNFVYIFFNICNFLIIKFFIFNSDCFFF